MIQDPATGIWYEVAKPASATKPAPTSALVQNPRTGEWEKRPVGQGTPQTPMPRRSWDVDGEPDAFDFQFTTKEGATVFCKYARNLEELGKFQDKMVEDGNAVANLGQEFQTMLATPGTTPEALLAKKNELAAIVKEKRVAQFDIARRVVGECVIGWEGAPKPFSLEARIRLPFDLCVEFMQEIINQSQITEKEADFLGVSSPTSSAPAPSTGEA